MTLKQIYDYKLAVNNDLCSNTISLADELSSCLNTPATAVSHKSVLITTEQCSYEQLNPIITNIFGKVDCNPYLVYDILPLSNTKFLVKL